jgi:protein phosphatase
MGGHLHGAEASAIASGTLHCFLLDNVVAQFMDKTDQNWFSNKAYFVDLVKSGFEITHSVVKKEVSGGGTTLTSFLLLDKIAVVGHVGDSRVYRITSDERIIQLTRDHSLVNRLMELGKLDPEEIKYHPQRNILYQAIGQVDHDPEPEVCTLSIDPGDRILICSDGLWGVVRDKDILKTATRSEDLDGICQSLVRMANHNGGPDNISVVLIEI